MYRGIGAHTDLCPERTLICARSNSCRLFTAAFCSGTTHRVPRMCSVVSKHLPPCPSTNTVSLVDDEWEFLCGLDGATVLEKSTGWRKQTYIP